MKQNKLFKNCSITLIWSWLTIFALIPSFFLFITSVLTPGDNELVRLQLSIANYLKLFNAGYLQIFKRSFVPLAVTVLNQILN